MTRVFIYGSCVTRDSVTWFKDYGLEMVGYVARQSLISAYRPSNSSEYDFSAIKSNFQSRMCKGDVEGNLRFEIQRSAPDVIFWDLCDERLGVRIVKSGGMVTQSRNHVAEGLHPGPFGRALLFGADDHFELWNRGLKQFMSTLDRLGLSDRLYLNATPWAMKDEFGNEQSALAKRAKDFNSKAERYLNLAGEKGAQVVRTRQDDAVSQSVGHKWGAAPFHYTEGTYKAMLSNLRDAM
ncbi:DUF6270 domain-containing protein [Glutamicibacter sp. HZAU]|uniref:DUF6270 domain-containing protein n=1 Tax=Glutamicibacter sp. HZAU TaxID=2049891 RepID=UPI000FFC95E5|nr:DUF6270 domain-containing protein [Glutamicibacter sp. HZAU]RWZ83773.1 hypothetical protein EKH49_08210 [Glutamicibacter sp. HZAU]